MKPFKKKITVPIYEADVWLIVAEDIHQERVKMNGLFGAPPREYTYSALSSYDGAGTFGLFFEPKYADTCRVSHEVFHLTHRILEWTGSEFDKDHHEQGAMLHGYLMERIMSDTERFRKKNKLL